MDSPLDVVIGKTLRGIRRGHGISQEGLARELHTSQGTVSRTEAGKRSIKLSEAITSSACLGTTPERLFESIRDALADAGLVEKGPRRPR